MKLNKFKRNLKKEYTNTINNKEKKPYFKFKYIAYLLVGALALFLIIDFVNVSIYNSNIEKLNNSYSYSFFDEEATKINDKNDYESIKAKINFVMQSKKKTVIEKIFSIRLMGCDSKTTFPGVEQPPSINDAVNEGDSSFETNVQNREIDEADVAKCDGTYIYSLHNGILYIFDLSGNKLASYNIDGKYLYIKNNKIIVLGNTEANILAFDKEVKKLFSLKYSTYEDSRFTNDTVYILSSSILSNELNYSNLYYNGGFRIESRYSITSYNLENGISENIEVLATSNSIFYSSSNYFYLVDSCSNTTAISIINYNLSMYDTIKLNGCVINQFALDEYNGYLRVATTNNSFEECKINALSIYNLNTLELVGLIDSNIGIAYQTIRSVSFKNEICYIVTYQNTDPLYEINCSDPTKPYIVSAYKAPGYSTYLLNFIINDTNYVLGLGYTDIRDYKISLYISNNGTTQVGKDYILGNINYDMTDYVIDYTTSLFENHKSLFIYNDNNNLFIGFEVGFNKYAIFKIDTNSDNVVCLYKEIDLDESTNKRSFLVNGKLYITFNDNIKIIEW